MTQSQFLYAIFLVFITYFAIMVFYYLLLIMVSLAHFRKRAFEVEQEDYSILSESYFTLPVSIIVPAHNEEDWIEDCVKSLLNLKYPQFEIIIVNDASTDRTLEILKEMLKLEPRDRPYSPTLRDGRVHEIYTSILYPNVTLINKSGLKKAGALNSAVTIARYKYVCAIDADTILEPDSIINIMSEVQKNPERIVGIGSYFGLVNGFRIKEGRIAERSFSYNPIIAYQNLEYLRSFMGNRIAWSAFNAIPIVSGGFGLWRRDILFEVGGYDPSFTCEDIELTFRIQDYIIRNKKDYNILYLPDYAGWTEGPATLNSLIIQRARWQRVTNETVWHYKYMLFNPKYRWFGFLTFPYFVLYEFLGAVFEVASLSIILWAWAAGILNVMTFLAYIGLMALTQTFISLFVLFVSIRQHRIFRLRYTLYLIVLSFIEFFLYRWILSVAKIKGIIDYLRGVKTFTQYKREERR